MTPSKPKDDLGQAEIQKTVEAEQDQGFHGTKVDPLPNEAHSLESGPDSPTMLEQRAALADAESKKGA